MKQSKKQNKIKKTIQNKTKQNNKNKSKTKQTLYMVVNQVLKMEVSFADIIISSSCSYLLLQEYKDSKKRYDFINNC